MATQCWASKPHPCGPMTLAVCTGGEPPYECKPLHVALQDDGTLAPTDDWSQIIIEQVHISLTPPYSLPQGLWVRKGCAR